MGRKRAGQELQEKIDGYLEEYELDDLNQANDMASLLEMCQIELNMAKMHKAFNKLDIVVDTKKARELTAALRDANQNWVTLQNELGINRRKRQSASDESPLQYIEKLQGQAKKMIESRFKKFVCPHCKQLLGKYMFYVIDKGEKGSIESKVKPVEAYKYTIRHECWKCGKIAEETNE